MFCMNSALAAEGSDSSSPQRNRVKIRGSTESVVDGRGWPWVAVGDRRDVHRPLYKPNSNDYHLKLLSERPVWSRFSAMAFVDL